MRVAAVERVTANAVRIRLVEDAGDPVAFVPGQFLTLAVRIDGITVACKRVPSGVVSTYLVDRLRPGERIDVLGPSPKR